MGAATVGAFFLFVAVGSAVPIAVFVFFVLFCLGLEEDVLYSSSSPCSDTSFRVR